jgi:hypothetical protein
MNLRSTVALLLFGLALASSTASAAGAVKREVRVGSYRVERDVTPGRNKVVGTLTNMGCTPVRDVKVSFRLFDAKGRVIGRATDEAHDLQPGQTWKFHAVAHGNVSRARLLQVKTQ